MTLLGGAVQRRVKVTMTSLVEKSFACNALSLTTSTCLCPNKLFPRGLKTEAEGGIGIGGVGREDGVDLGHLTTCPERHLWGVWWRGFQRTPVDINCYCRSVHSRLKLSLCMQFI